MITLIAYRMTHAEYYNRNVLHEPPSNLRIVTDPRSLYGLLYGSEVTFVRDRAYKATNVELHKRALITELCAARGFIVHEVWI